MRKAGINVTLIYRRQFTMNFMPELDIIDSYQGHTFVPMRKLNYAFCAEAGG